jgi:excisionase family DNA binding protein
VKATTIEADRPVEWLSPAQLADELQIPLATVYVWRSRHKGPRGHKIGSHVRYSRSDVAAWLETLADPREAA